MYNNIMYAMFEVIITAGQNFMEIIPIVCLHNLKNTHFSSAAVRGLGVIELTLDICIDNSSGSIKEIVWAH